MRSFSLPVVWNITFSFFHLRDPTLPRSNLIRGITRHFKWCSLVSLRNNTDSGNCFRLSTWKCGESGRWRSQFFFKHHILPIRLYSCAALLPCWLKRLITHHSLGGSQLCVFSLKRPLPGLCHKSWGRKGLRRSRPLCGMPCDSFKIPFPFWPSCTVSGPNLVHQLSHHSGCPGSLSSILLGKFEHSFHYQPGEKSDPLQL